MWAAWWVWVALGFALGVLEVLVAGYVFLGFAIGAVIVGALLAMGILGGSLAVLILVFAVASLASWAVLRRVLGTPKGQVKIWDKDINEN